MQSITLHIVEFGSYILIKRQEKPTKYLIRGKEQRLTDHLCDHLIY